jgi:predicted amidohydrolase
MLFLPENFGMFGDSTEQTLEQAEPPLTDDARENPSSVSQLLRETIRASSGGDDTPSSDKSVDFISLLEGIKTIAGESNVWISGGGMHVSGAPPADQSAIPRVYNTHIVVDNEGTLKCFYRKAHLFDVSIPGKVNLRESTTTAPGTELVMCDSPIGTCACIS